MRMTKDRNSISITKDNIDPLKTVAEKKPTKQTRIKKNYLWYSPFSIVQRNDRKSE